MVYAQSSSAEVSAPSDRVRISSVVTDGFIHPGISFTAETLDNARKQIIAKKEPWYSGYVALATNRDSGTTVSCRNQSKSDPSKPDVDAFDNRGINDRLIGDSYKAKRQALMYYFTGNEVHRANAMNIVRVWSQMDPAKYKNWQEAHIHSCYPIQRMIVAAEILRYSDSQEPKLAWTDQDTDNFTRNFVTPCIKTFLDGNGWFMNQNGYPIAAAMSGDIFTNDRKSYEKRVEWFTVNKDAPNKGWSSSIHDLARKIDKNAITGEKVDPPVVQLIEMGRDQAHAGGDVEIFNNTAQMMNVQGTRVDPVTGTISTQPNVVGPYEFLDDRILAVCDYFCRFMLGYDTPWVPAASDIASDGKVRGIYPRIADNYRGRIRGLDFWDAYYYYSFKKGADLSKIAPYYHKAFLKRIVNSDTDWISIPANVSGEGAKIPPREQEPKSIDIVQRSTFFDDKVSIVNEEDQSFLRVTPTAAGTRIAILSADTNQKTIALRIRTNGVTEISMSGLNQPWLLPDTQNQWQYVIYTLSRIERFRDIEYFLIKGSSSTRVDLQKLVRDGEMKPYTSVAFKTGGESLEQIVFAGAPVTVDFSAGGEVTNPTIASRDLPTTAKLDAKTGAFTWTATQGEHLFHVNLSDGNTTAVKKIRFIVEKDRESAMKRVLSRYKTDIPYVKRTQSKVEASVAEIRQLGRDVDDKLYFEKLIQLQSAIQSLEPLTPMLADQTMDYPKIANSPTIGDSIGLLTDGNNDTFPVYTLAKDLNYIFDFGENYRVAFTTFSIQGRLNFEGRTIDTAFFGSNDLKTWTQLTRPIDEFPATLIRADVDSKYQQDQFRYLKIEKTSRRLAPIFEPSELRITGRRYEVE